MVSCGPLNNRRGKRAARTVRRGGAVAFFLVVATIMDPNMRDLLAEISKFNAQTAGRDKFFRLLQYSSRLLWYWLQKTSNRRDTVARLQNLEVTFSSGRRREFDLFSSAVASGITD